MTNEDFIAAQTAAEAPPPEATVQKEPKSPKEDEGQAPLNVDSPKFAGKEIKQ